MGLQAEVRDGEEGPDEDRDAIGLLAGERALGDVGARAAGAEERVLEEIAERIPQDPPPQQGDEDEDTAGEGGQERGPEDELRSTQSADGGEELDIPSPESRAHEGAENEHQQQRRTDPLQA